MDKATPGVGWYDKHHLVPFTEFVPVPEIRCASGCGSWTCRIRISIAARRSRRHWKPRGSASPRASAYEDAYGVDAVAGIAHCDDAGERHQRRLVRPFSARYQHLQISRMRAMEAGRPMVRAANDGVSAIIGQRGEIIASAPEYEANVLRAEVQPRIGLTPYARSGNWPIVCLALVFGLFGAYLKRRPSKV